MTKTPHGPDNLTDWFTQQWWDERYSGDAVWSGNPNIRLVEQISGLEPGSALDVGSGEGGDVIWLAQQGWTVTGVDISPVGLARADGHARAAGFDDITWLQADMYTWEPEPAQFDLVTANFMHLPQPTLSSLHRRLATAVRPGGTLLIVLHERSEMHAAMSPEGTPSMFAGVDDIVAAIDPAQWTSIETATPARDVTTPDGDTVTIRDVIVKATRRR